MELAGESGRCPRAIGNGSMGGPMPEFVLLADRFRPVLRCEFRVGASATSPRWLLALSCCVAALIGPRIALTQPIPQRAAYGLEIRADSQFRQGSVRRATGDVELRYGRVILTADELEYDEASGQLEAQGKVHYRTTDGEQDLQAERLSYNTISELGTFYEGRGVASYASQGGVRLLTTDNPFLFEAKVIHKAGDHYSIHRGRLTNCDPIKPWWTLRAANAEVTPQASAIVRNAVFRLKGVPLLYVPYFRKSLKRMPRQSGLLTPTIGNSSRFGRILGQSYFWAINRSYDATLGATWYTARGVASTASLRGRPTKNSSFDAVFFDMRDRGRELDDGSRLKQGGNSFDLKGKAMFGDGWRGVVDLRYLSSLEFRQAFTQSYEEAVFSQIRSIGFVTKNFSTYSFNVSLLRNEHFQSVSRDDNIVIDRKSVV